MLTGGSTSRPATPEEKAMASVDLNADMGEGFGPWKMGDDDAMLSIVSSANIACGWHAGDPIIMHRTAEIAKAKGVSIGAHPGFGDLWGFGRRTIRGETMADIEKQVAYQIGAMQACAALAGHKVTHVKAHGALGNMSNDDEDIALAIGRAIKGVDPSLVFVVMPTLPTERVGEKLGLPMAREIFADRTYDDSGNLLDDDTETDDVPIVNVVPRWTGRFRVTVKMHACSTNPCAFGLAVFRN